MFVDEGKYMILKEFEELGVGAIYTHMGLGNVQDLETRETLLKEIKCCNKKLVYGKQTHSENVVKVEDSSSFFYEDCDGFVTNSKNIVIFTQYADCLPIYFYDKINKAIGICHSGWKGSFKKIALNLINLMKKEYGTDVENLLIGLGIGISRERYEVSNEFYREFESEFSETILNNCFKFSDNKIYFDNQEFNYHLLLENGASKDNIIRNNLCTYEDKKFHSHRRDGSGAGRNGGYIYFK
ncbi:MAG: peptidoglycan editing factor PgeF [Cetobacterium sp.]|uniref:peptidoglycan editing factor PgeF n=1 Tax=unclassified Cetobacterium TaxID=2630983 RepID=UPI00163BC0AB|nr:peptidoglycan editing factor PgeF [Cetobacterium sp. 2A]MBC2856439.1 peptidoglycan editing factor PgeF [Cetobacterium sp. 2A]